MSADFDLDAFERDLDNGLQKSREAFKGKYKKELDDLLGFSQDEIDSITPDTTDLQKYDELVTVVKEASRINLSQADLAKRIEKLGEVAVKIAKKVPSLTRLFL